MSLSYFGEEVFETVNFYLIYLAKQVSQLTFGKSLLVEPYNIGFGKIDKAGTRILAEGHDRFGKFHEMCLLRIEFVIHVSIVAVEETTQTAKDRSFFFAAAYGARDGANYSFCHA